MISRRAQLSKNALVWKNDFDLTEDQKVFLLPHIVCFESYVKAFQYKVLNSILYTNVKLFKIGYIADDKCTFCKSESETLTHLFSTAYIQSFSGKILNSTTIVSYHMRGKITIYMLQEVHCSENTADLWACEWGYKTLFACCSSNKAGVSILFNNTFNLQILKVFSDPNGRFIICDIRPSTKTIQTFFMPLITYPASTAKKL